MTDAQYAVEKWQDDSLFLDENGKRICCIKGCDRTHEGRGFCAKHLHQLNKNGSPVHKPGSTQGFSDKEKIDFNTKINSDGCWEWTGYVGNHGYGVIRANGKNQQAHRFAFEVLVDAIPEGLYVCHKCDNRVCVNPDHLFLGTHQDNMDDMDRKGRRATGENFGKTKLTRDAVLDIRARYSELGRYRLAEIHNVSPQTVYQTAKRITNNWVE